jgi:L-ascorbate metabolism protein UlaG (beta-lactamase superfamily)
MYIFVVILLSIALLVYLISNLPVFGKKPEGRRLAQIRQLPNYQNGVLHNLSPTPMKPDNVSYWQMIRGMLKRNINRSPRFALPSIKPEFKPSNGTSVTWFGHSSYLLQVDGFNILVDPVFSATPSPFPFMGYKSFKGTDFIHPEDLPELDVILITHDHYDHLDYESVLKLSQKTRLFITSLGVGAHLEHWNVPVEKIRELYWGEELVVKDLKFTATPSRHFTGRSFKRNQTVWSSFVLQTAQHKLFLGGDSGYDKHFKEIGNIHGPFDLAILECGQYNSYWPYIHMFPQETVQAALDLKAAVLMPVHWGKYTLAMHNWNEPVINVVKAAQDKKLKVTTPQLGEKVQVGIYYPDQQWWLSSSEIKQNSL